MHTIMRLLTVLILGCSAISEATVTITQALSRASRDANIPKEILTAICQAESNLNPKAYVYHDGGEGNSAIGLCQVLVNTASEFIKVSPGCYTNLTVSNEKCNLLDPYTNALVAAKYLKKQYERYSKSWVSAILAYNSGSLKTCKTGLVRNKEGKVLYKCVKGGPLNQRYLDRVLNYMK